MPGVWLKAGGELETCPVDPGCVVTVRMRDGRTYVAFPAGGWCWGEAHDATIEKYLVHRPPIGAYLLQIAESVPQ